MTTRAEKRLDIGATAVAAALSRVIELTDAGAPPRKRAAARAHAEALCRRWRLSLRDGEQAALGRDLGEGSIVNTHVGSPRDLRQMNGKRTHG